MFSPEFTIKKVLSEKAPNEGFLQLPGLLFYLPIGKGSEMELKVDSAEEMPVKEVLKKIDSAEVQQMPLFPRKSY